MGAVTADTVCPIVVVRSLRDRTIRSRRDRTTPERRRRSRQGLPGLVVRSLRDRTFRSRRDRTTLLESSIRSTDNHPQVTPHPSERVLSMASRLLLLAGVVTLFGQSARAADETPTNVTWKKTVIDKRFVSEGVAIADVNKDGKMDILNGEFWYEAPDWKPHRMRQGGEYKEDYREGEKNVYSKSFCCWAEDINKDGWVDCLVVPFPGAPMNWYENPQGKDGLWKEHVLWHSACNETPQFADLLGNGKRVLIMGSQPKGKGDQGQMAFFTPGKDPTQLWEMHPISEPSSPGKEVPGTRQFSHGLGIGDVNGDGRNDVIISNGWWEQPEKVEDKPWKFHPAPLGEACADMFAYDIDGDNKADVISSSAHKFGIWSFRQKGDSFVKVDLFPKLVSETHAMHCVDINGDGVKDLVTGKRYWSHGRKGEPGSDMPAVLYWFEAKKASDGVITFLPHTIDDDSGIGTQFVVDDFNGDKLLDIVISNKKGVFLFEQGRK